MTFTTYVVFGPAKTKETAGRSLYRTHRSFTQLSSTVEAVGSSKSFEKQDFFLTRTLRTIYLETYNSFNMSGDYKSKIKTGRLYSIHKTRVC